MAEMTVLEMTQNVLASMSSDQVNSIGDTDESMQIAQIIRNKYYDILSRGNLPEQNVLFQLDSSLDATKPILMRVPIGTARIDWIKYFDANPNDNLQQDQFGAFSHGVNSSITSTNKWTTTSSTSNTIGTGSKTFTVGSSSLSVTVGQSVLIQAGLSTTTTMTGTLTSYTGTTMVINVTGITGSGTYTSWTLSSTTSNPPAGYRYVTILPIEQYLDYVNRFNPSESNVHSFNFTEGGRNFTLYYRDDRQPQYCTLIETKYVIFDALNTTFDDTLQTSKTMVYGNAISPFQLSDTFIPDMDDNQFPLLLNEVKAVAFFELKQMPHMKAEQEIKRQWSAVQKNKSMDNKPSYFDQMPNYGRVPRTGGYASGGYAAYKWMRQSSP